MLPGEVRKARLGRKPRTAEIGQNLQPDLAGFTGVTVQGPVDSASSSTSLPWVSRITSTTYLFDNKGTLPP